MLSQQHGGRVLWIWDAHRPCHTLLPPTLHDNPTGLSLTTHLQIRTSHVRRQSPSEGMESALRSDWPHRWLGHFFLVVRTSPVPQSFGVLTNPRSGNSSGRRIATLSDVGSSGGAPAPPPSSGQSHGSSSSDDENSNSGQEGESWFAGGERRCALDLFLIVFARSPEREPCLAGSPCRIPTGQETTPPAEAWCAIFCAVQQSKCCFSLFPLYSPQCTLECRAASRSLSMLLTGDVYRAVYKAYWLKANDSSVSHSIHSSCVRDRRCRVSVGI